ncbi:phytochrome B-like [Rosa chinensis]|uniref:phytochrome B-like n=1 Tax=Rosa chinensis TaxID=74649 RepID=UPI000D08B30A|nr:phytochrome B-like [Rosa chinensis]
MAWRHGAVLGWEAAVARGLLVGVVEDEEKERWMSLVGMTMKQITAYLSKIQRGYHIQPFGCTIEVEESTFGVIAYNENARDLLDLRPQSVPVLERQEILTIKTDVRTLFTPSSSTLLEKAFRAPEITLLNPILIHSRVSGRPFYAILHRIDVGVVIDLEPTRIEDPALSIAGAVQSQKLVVRAISQLQSLPGGDIKLLCDMVVESVRELTGYDRVLEYKFHEDEHGEVLAEVGDINKATEQDGKQGNRKR